MSLALLEAAPARDPLAGFDLETLTRGAARLRPDRIAMSDASGVALTFAALDQRADAMAGRLRDIGLVVGETLMIAGGASVSTCLGLLAGSRAGLNVALAPLHAPGAMLAAFAARAGASAIVAPGAYGEFRPIEDMYEVAARTPEARIVCCLGPGNSDGAVPLDDPDWAPATPAPASTGAPSRIATFAPGGGVVFHSQRALVAAALDIAARARVGMAAPLLSTLAPVGFAGLAAGPFLSLIAGATLHFHGPFDSTGFIDDLDRLGPSVVIAPGALAGPFAEAGLIRGERLTALLLVDRTTEARGALAPLGDTGGVPIVDLHAFGEEALIAEARDASSRPLPPAREPHMIHMDDMSILAIRRRDGNGPLAFEGEAVSN